MRYYNSMLHSESTGQENMKQTTLFPAQRQTSLFVHELFYLPAVRKMFYIMLSIINANNFS
jgi:hypothetical protein